MFRWRPPAPVGLPHLVNDDDKFMGYTISQGSTVLACIYTIHLRPEDYDRPEVFQPERYMKSPYGTKFKVKEEEAGDNSAADDAETRKPTYMFGAGRRACPGDQFAMNSILLAAAKLLWALTCHMIVMVMVMMGLRI